MRVLISDRISEVALRLFEEAGVAADFAPSISREELLERVPAYDGLIVRSGTRVDRELLDRASSLRVVVRAGVGVDNIDLPAATAQGVLVMNTPEGNTISAAEHTFALLLSLARHVPEATATMKKGEWRRSDFVGTELNGKTLGIIGLGKIGREVAQRAQAFEMEVIAHDPVLPDEVVRQLKVRPVDRQTLYAESDIITLHVPLTDETRGMIDATVISGCKAGVRFVNCARGGLIDEEALLDALDSGRVAGAGLDVFSEEPPGETALVQHPRVVTTPHLGASTVEAQTNVGVMAVRQAIGYLQKEAIQNAVNTVAINPEVRKAVQPFVVLAEKLGEAQAQLLDGHPREIRITYAGELPSDEGRRFITLSFLKGFLRHFLDAPVNEVSAGHLVKERGIDLAESTSTRSEGFTTLIRTTVRTDDDRVRRFSGTLFGTNSPRIVFVDDYLTDAIPEGNALFIVNDDRPGIIGHVGTTLGNAGVNIANLSVGRDRKEGTALAIFNVDERLSDDLLDELRDAPGIRSAQQVRF